MRSPPSASHCRTDANEPNRSSQTSSTSHWRPGDRCRIFSGWPPRRRNAWRTLRVGKIGGRRGRLNYRIPRRETMSGLGKTLAPALMLVGVSVAASAQQKACEVDEGSPAQVARAYLDIQQASVAKPADAAKQLRDAVKLLNDGDLKKNPTGRA